MEAFWFKVWCSIKTHLLNQIWTQLLALHPPLKVSQVYGDLEWSLGISIIEVPQFTLRCHWDGDQCCVK